MKHQTIQSMQNRLKDQQQLIQKLKDEDSKIQKSLEQFKLKMNGNLHQQNQHKSIKTVYEQISAYRNIVNVKDRQKTMRQLDKQIQILKNNLQNYQYQLKMVQSNHSKITTSHLDQLQGNIHQKNRILTSLKQEIKDLEFVKRKQDKMIEIKKKEEDGTKLTKLIDQLKKNRYNLQKVKEKHTLGRSNLQSKESQVLQLQKQYKKTCNQHKVTPLTFDDFKQRKKQKKLNNTKQKQRKKITTVKDIRNGQASSKKKIQYNENTLDQLKIKKQIALNSMQNSQRKYQKQLDQLSRKLCSLEIENKKLNDILQQKKYRTQYEGSDNNSSSRKYHSAHKLQPLKIK